MRVLYASGGETVAHGVAAAKGDYACRSTADGVTCWNTKSGKSFALARAGWMTGTNGEITPRIRMISSLTRSQRRTPEDFLGGPLVSHAG